MTEFNKQPAANPNQSGASKTFASNWLRGIVSRSGRRRLMAVLRMAHSVLGMKRRRMGLGALGAGQIAAFLMAMGVALTPTGEALAQVAGYGAGGGTSATNPSNNSQLLNRNTGSGNLNYPVSGTANSIQGGVAIGIGASTGTWGGTAVGFNNVATGGNAFPAYAFGAENLATGPASIALGDANQTTASSAVAIGVINTASGNTSIVLGRQSLGSQAFSIAMGNTTSATNIGAVAIGNSASAGGAGSIAIGVGNNEGTAAAPVTTHDTTASNAAGTNSIAIGTASSATATNDVALGANTRAFGVNGTGSAVAIGSGNTATGAGAVAIGDPSVANGQGAFAAGFNSIATATGAAAGGPANGAVAIGNTAIATGQGSVSIGNTTSVALAGGIALGDAAKTAQLNGIAIGTGASAVNAGDVALGSGARSRLPDGGPTGLYGVVAAGPANAATPTVSIGQPGAERQILNVAAGQISATSTDAINGSQLFAVSQGVNTVGTTVAADLGGGSTFNPATGSVTAPSYVLGGTTYTNVGSALVALSNEQDTVQWTSGGATTSTPSGTASLIGAGGSLTSPVVLSNVGAGLLSSTSTQAVNGSQLFAAGSSVAADLGGGSTFNPATGSVTNPSYVLGGTTYTNVGSALVALSTEQDTVQWTSGGATTTTPSGTASLVGAGGSLTSPVVLSNLGAGLLSSTSTQAVNGSQLFAAGSSVAADLGGGSAFNPATGSVTNPSYVLGGTTYNNVGSALVALSNEQDTVQWTSGGATTSTPSGTASLIGAGGSLTSPVVLSNVGAGLLSSTSTQAVNGSQLFAVGSSVATDLGGGSTFNPATGSVTNPSYVIGGTTYNNVGSALAAVVAVASDVDTVQYTSAIGGGTQPTASNTATLVGTSLGTPVTLENVAAGLLSSTSTQAVNGSQLFAAGSSVAADLGGGSTFNPATGSVTNPSYVLGGTTYTNVGSALVALSNEQDVVQYTSGGATTSTPSGTASLVGAGGSLTSPVVLSNVGAGLLSSTSTQAVNGSQLFATGSSVATDLGGGSTFNPATGSVTNPSYVIGGTTYNNVGSALTAITNLPDVDAVQYTSGGATTSTPSGTASLVGAGGSLTSPVVLSNVGAGLLSSTSTQAVNGSQLFATGSSVATDLGGGSTFNPATGSVTNPSYVIGGTTYNNVGSALAAINVLASSDVDTVQYTSGVGGGTQATPSNTATLVGAGGSLTGGVILDNVAPGALTATSLQAVNGSQLFATGSSVATDLGGGSTFNPATGSVTNPSYVIGGTTYNNVGSALTAITNLPDVDAVQYTSGGATTSTPSGTASLVGAGGSLTSPVVLSNVGAGLLSSTSTQAVNGSQLFATGSSVATDLGGGSTFNPATGSVTNPSYVIGGTTYNNVGSALTAITNLPDVDAVQYTSGGATTSTPSGTASLVGAGGSLTSPVVLSNVGAGLLSSTSTQAVNGSQLFATGSSVATDLGGGSTFNPATGSVTNPSYVIGGTTYNNVGSALAAINVLASSDVDTVQYTSGVGGGTQATPSNTATLVGAGGSLTGGVILDNVAPGALTATSLQAVNGSQLFATGSSVATDLGGGSTFNPATGSVTNPSYVIGGTTYNNVGSALTAITNLPDVDAVQYTSGGATTSTPSGTASLVGAGGSLTSPVVLSNVGAGLLSSTSTQAVNGSQLFATGSSVATDLGGGSTFNPATGSVTNPSYVIGGTTYNNVGSALTAITNLPDVDAVQYTSGGATTSTPSGTASLVGAGGSLTSPVVLSNVGAGLLSSTSTQAVNGSQLFAAGSSVASDLGGGSTFNPATGSVTNPSYVIGGTTYNNVGSALTAITNLPDVDAVQYTSGGATTSTPSGTASLVGAGGSLTSPVVLSNVGAGLLSSTSTQAVNGSQLFATGSSVATDLGGGSTFDPTTGSVTNPSYVIGGTTYNNVGSALTAITNLPDVDAVQYTSGGATTSTPSGTASLVGAGGSLTSPVVLSNVGAGLLSSTSTQAVNGSQLFATGSSVATDLGGGSTFDPTTGSVTNPSYVLGGTTYNNVGSALVALSNEQDTVQYTTGVGGSTTATPSNTATLVGAGGSLTSPVVLSNVGAGLLSSTSTQAVNGSQLFATGSSVATDLGGGSTFDPTTGSVTNPSYVLGGTTYNNVGSALVALSNEQDTVQYTTGVGGSTTATPSNTATLVGAGGSLTGGVVLDNVAPGALTPTSLQAVNGSQLFAAGSSVASDLGGGSTFNPATGSVTNPSYVIGGTTYNNVGSALTAITNLPDVDAVQYTSGGATTSTPSGTASLVGAGGSLTSPVVLSNVGAGLLSSTSTQAVNGSQLFATGSSVATDLGGGSTFDPTTGSVTNPSYVIGGTTYNNVGSALTAITNLPDVDAVQYTSGGATTSTPSGTASLVGAGGSLTSPVVLSNVGAGLLSSTSTDAVNGSQLFATGTSTASDLGGGSTFDPTTGSVTAPSYAIAGSTYNNVGSALAAITGGSPYAGVKYFHANSTGPDSNPAGTDAIAIGAGSVANGNSSIAEGLNALTGQVGFDTAVGALSSATGGYSTAIGYQATSSGEYSTALGNRANAAGFDSFAGGYASSAGGGLSTAVGPFANAGGQYGTAIGGSATASGGFSTALGARATAGANNSVAIGLNAVANNQGDVALGANAVTGAVNAGTTDLTGGTAAGVEPAGVVQGTVSVGSPGLERQIQNVAAGTLTATSTDAVNGSQLFSVATAANTIGSTVAANFGGGSTYDPATGVSAPSYVIGGSTYNNVGSALAAITGGSPFAGVKYFHANSTGVDSNPVGTDSVAIGTGAVATNQGDVALGANSTTGAVNTGTTAVFGGTAAGVEAVGATQGTVSVGSGGVGDNPVFDRQIQNVAAGTISTTSTDAVNGSQLFSVVTGVNNLGSSVAADLGGGATYDPTTGNVLNPTYVIQGSSYNNVGSALGAVDNSISSIVNGGAGPVQYSNAATPTTPNGGTKTNDVTLVGAAAGPVGLHNVANGLLSTTSTDAVNGSQLNATNQQVTTNTTAITNLENGTAGLVQQAGGAPGSGQITVGAQTGGTSISVAGTDGNRTISGVADGLNAHDAVNVEQLQAALTGEQDGEVLYDNPATKSKITLGATTSTDGGVTNGTTITNLHQGALTATSTDAVNGSQLYATNVNVNNLLNGKAGPFQSNNTNELPPPSASGSNSAAGGFGAVASGANSTAMGNSSTASGAGSTALGNGAISSGNNSVAIGAGSNDGGLANVVSFGTPGHERVLTNVAPGVNGTDAVNVNQLSALGINLRNNINQINLQAQAGTAMALAASGLRYDDRPGTTSIAGAASGYSNHAGIAFGLGHTSDNGNLRYNISASFASPTDHADVGVVAGISYTFGH